MKRSLFLKALVAIPFVGAFVKKEPSPYNKDEKKNREILARYPLTPEESFHSVSGVHTLQSGTCCSIASFNRNTSCTG